MSKVTKLARIATVPFFLDNQLRGQMQYLVQRGFEVSAIASSDGNWDRLQQVEGLECIPLDILREPSPLDDLKTLFHLYKLFKSNDFGIVHSTTPKAGLLSALAAKLAGVPISLHTFTGQPWATKKGFARWVYRFFDKCIVWLNTQCYADSTSQQQFLVKEGVGDNTTIKVLGSGSIAGVDMTRFNVANWQHKSRDIREQLSLSESAFVLTFIGRLSKEKGIFELIEAFDSLKIKYPDLHLLLVGPCEESLVAEQLDSWAQKKGLHIISETDCPEKYLSISHLLCLPSYREGFGTVVIEAASMAVPTLGTKITGLSDAVEHNITGKLVNPQDQAALKNAMEELIVNKELCEKIGRNAYIRCREKFDASLINKLILKEYEFLIRTTGLTTP